MGRVFIAAQCSPIPQDYKLHIILNKVDQFDNIHDFARAYGSLCWNLSKVIPRKDLPRIYTMCVPTEHHQGPSRGLWDTESAAGEFLTSSRDDVVAEVRESFGGPVAFGEDLAVYPVGPAASPQAQGERGSQPSTR